MLAQRTRHPIPVAGVIQAAVHQQKRRQVILSPIPELQLQSIRIVVVRDGFQSNYCKGPVDRSRLWFYLLYSVCSRTSAWCRTSIPFTRNKTSSAMLVA